MEIKILNNIGVVAIENVYSNNEYSDIWNELCTYIDRNILLPPDQTRSAKYNDGSLKKKNSAIFVDSLYTERGRKLSPILEYSENKLMNPLLKEELKKANMFYGIMKSVNTHFTLVNYYENSDHYDFHHDAAGFTILTFFFKEPKKFSGGNIIIKAEEGGKEYNIDIKNNMALFFPSHYLHKVTPIEMDKKNMNNNLGRFSIAHFMYINS